MPGYNDNPFPFSRKRRQSLPERSFEIDLQRMMEVAYQARPTEGPALVSNSGAFAGGSVLAEPLPVLPPVTQGQTIGEAIFGAGFRSWRGPSAVGRYGASRDGGRRAHAGLDLPFLNYRFPFGGIVTRASLDSKGGGTLRIYVPEFDVSMIFRHVVLPSNWQALNGKRVTPGELELNMSRGGGPQSAYGVSGAYRQRGRYHQDVWSGTSWSAPHTHVEIIVGQHGGGAGVYDVKGARKVDPYPFFRQTVSQGRSRSGW